MNNKGQAGAAGALLALIAVFVLLYLLMIPADLREELLNDGSSGKKPSEEEPAGARFNKTVFTASPGRIDYLKFSEYEHPLPAVNLYSSSSAKTKQIGDGIYVKNGIFDRKDANVSFRLDNNAQNVFLSFSLSPNRNNRGRLQIALNGNTIYNRQPSGQTRPIRLEGLNTENTLTFFVSGVGYRFWTTNEYEILDLALFYDVVDDSTQTSKNTFMVTESEKFNLESAQIKFFPDCNRHTAGRLNVYMNSNLIYSAVPDCGQINMVELSPAAVEAGQNRVTFASEGGNYLIDNIVVKTEMKSMTYPAYYFDLPASLFSKQVEEDADEDCGDIDGVCPKGCDPDQDKDCCLKETSSYWCDYQPANQDDRCRGVTNVRYCYLCPSGYENIHGDAPEECEDLCGDDNDGVCPGGCSRYYDKDCCYEIDPENFWCDDIPKYGLATCKDAITRDECSACASGWQSDESDFTCLAETDDDTVAVLKSSYDVRLTLKFADARDKKAGRVFVNGYQFYFSTYDDEYDRVIDSYVEDGTNSVKIEPDQSVLEIRELVIEIED